MLIRQIHFGEYEISELAGISSRKIFKISIFLDGMPNVNFENIQDIIKIQMKSTDKIYVNSLVSEIVEFIKNQDDNVIIEDSVQKIIDEHELINENISQTLEKLKAIQNEDATVSVEYNEFCSFCDKNLKIRLRPYQYKSAFLLCVGKGGFDFSVPGAGKTIITYASYAYLSNKEIITNILIIGPISSYNAWFDEYITCFGANPEFMNLSGKTIEDCKIYLSASSQNHSKITFINIDKIRLLQKELCEFVSIHKTLLVIDEAHKIKNPAAAVTSAAIEISKLANYRILLTGTPMPNGYEDLYSLTQAYSPFNSILPYQYSQLKQMSRSEVRQSEVTRIKESIAPYYSRISQKYLLETKELLPPHFNTVYCDMNSDQRQLYNRLDDFIGKMSEDVEEDILLYFKKAVLIRKMQISANPALLHKSLIDSMDEFQSNYFHDIAENNDIEKLQKIDEKIMKQFMDSSITRMILQYDRGDICSSKNHKVVELVSKILEKGNKVLIWDIFVQNMAMLQALLKEELSISIEMINGSINSRDRQKAIENFKVGNSQVLLANPATLAESISLHHVCQNAIYVNRNFNAAQFIQSKNRIHRINMPRGTTANYYFLMNIASVDEYVDERLNNKEQRMLAVLDEDDIICGGGDMEDKNIMSDIDIENGYKR